MSNERGKFVVFTETEALAGGSGGLLGLGVGDELIMAADRPHFRAAERVQQLNAAMQPGHQLTKQQQAEYRTVAAQSLSSSDIFLQLGEATGLAIVGAALLATISSRARYRAHRRQAKLTPKT